MNTSTISSSIGFFFILAVCVFTISSCKDDSTTTPTTAPTDLKYNPNSAVIDQGKGFTSVAPTISGTTPITFALTTSPDAGNNIIIDAKSGVIVVGAAAAPNIYSAKVTATNSAGSTAFDKAFSIEIKAVKKVTFKGDVQPIIKKSCSPCHVYGGNNPNFGDSYTNAANNIDKIIDRINRKQGTPGFMPDGQAKLDAATIAIIEQWKTDGLFEE